MTKGENGMKKSVLITILMTAFVYIFQVFETKAAPGDYDQSFGIGGIAQFQFNNLKVIHQIAIQTDGKILAEGHTAFNQTFRLVLRRHNSDGTLDPAFGLNGEAVEHVGMGQYRRIKMSTPTRIAIQPDGKILVGGTRHSDDGFALGLSMWRFTANGFPDETFDGDGRKDFTDWI